MKKAVMMSIRPRWCCDIANELKKIEVRRTAPLLKPPFVDYIYCTNDRKETLNVANGEGLGKKGELYINGNIYYPHTDGTLNGKVIGEFVCDKIECVKGLPDIPWNDPNGERELRVCKDSCLTFEQIAKYGEGSNLWAWHISELKLYDKPKALGEFRHPCARPTGEYNCIGCKYQEQLSPTIYGCNPYVRRPPQSWCYVEEL